MTFALVAVIGFVSMGVNVGMWRYQRQLAQTAADSGAVAAAVELKNGGTLAQMYAAANVDATANMFAGSATNGARNSAGDVTVRVNNPPSSGNATANTNAVEVIVSKVLPVYFGWSSATVSARAVATNPSSGHCLVALDPSASNQGTITLDGGRLTLPTCDMYSNGQMLLNGGATINAKSISYRFGYTGSATYTGASPTLVTAAASDPCSMIAGCAYLTANVPIGTCAAQTTFTAPVTISPGKYCSQVIFGGAGTATLAAGVYDFAGGFNVNGSVNLAGTGVTLYNGGTFNFGLGTENLVAPTTGNYAGVLIFQPASNSNSFTFNGSAPAVLTGLVYAPGAEIILDGTSATLSEVVADTLLLNASGTLTFNGLSSTSAGNGGLTE